MEARDRLANLGFLAAGGIVFVLVALIFTTRDPTVDPGAGYLGALLLGLASASSPRRCSGSPSSAATVGSRIVATGRARSGAADGCSSSPRSSSILRLNRVFQPEIALFVLALVAVAEATLSVER